jgi:hypothetical protein
LDSTPFCNDTITDATLDARKLLEHHAKMSISMKESILATRYALEKLIQGLPESANKPRASIALQIDKLAAQLARIDQTLENATTSQSTTRAVIVHLQETLQMTVAPLTDIKDNLEHLHQKLDSLENTIDERLPSVTNFLGHGHINDRTGLVNADGSDDADTTSWATPDGCQTIYQDDDAATLATAACMFTPPTPYGTPYFLNRGSRRAPTPTSRYPAPSPPRSLSGGMSRALPGSAPSFHELAQSGAINWMLTDKGPYLGGVQKTFKTLSISLVTDGFDDFFRFYNGIITQLSLSDFHCRLLPPLNRIAPDVDLCRSPVNATCMPLSGDHCLAEWSQAAYWDEQHVHLSQLLYLTLTSKDVIKITAPITLGIINRHSQYTAMVLECFKP